MAKKKTGKRPSRSHAKRRAPQSTNKEIVAIPLSELHLDPRNPRFGTMAGKLRSEAGIVDFIVQQIGIQDVISSIAVNGFFSSEPLLARRENGRLTIAEGNRRLAACLILAGDPRAKNHNKLAVEFQKIHAQYSRQQFDPAPVVIFETEDEIKRLLPYLGVRHIAGAQEWDSYAKAAWVAQAVEEQGLGIKDVIHMIGDSTNLSRRMLHGYYVVNQLIDHGLFDPEESEKKGTKSNPEYPFSWVYTALGYRAIADWIDLPAEPKRDPLPPKGRQNASKLFAWMFGQDGIAPALSESRDIRELSSSIADSDKRRLLRNGLTIAEVARRTRPVTVQLSDYLTKAQLSLQDGIALLAEGEINPEEADECTGLSRRVRRLAIKFHRELERASGVAEDDDD